uniref:Uncharacterized protein n=1 Tax=Rhizophora mucronata TaxID=61149 RepID=A0A2P2J6M9_RHIMU
MLMFCFFILCFFRISLHPVRSRLTWEDRIKVHYRVSGNMGLPLLLYLSL